MKYLFQECKKLIKLVVVITCYILCPLIVQAIDIVQVELDEKVIVQAAWGHGKGQIGEVAGRLETTPGESINPISVDSKGNIYVGDSVNYRVQKYDLNGNIRYEIDLKKYDEWPYKNIPDISVDEHDNVYVVLLRKQQIVKYGKEGNLIKVIDLSKAGVLEKNSNGTMKIKEKGFFGIKRVIVDKNGNIYVLGSEDNVLKLDSNGAIIQRWGPYASNAINFIFIDSLNTLYIWMPPKQDGSMFKRYDMSGKILGSGLGMYDQIIEPFYYDSNGNVYGFTTFTDNVLAIYNHKHKRLYKLPIKQESLAFERWTVDSGGNIYYTRESGQFEVRKLSMPIGKKE